MRVEWAGSGPELLLTIDRNGPLGVQLAEQLRAAIRTGRLAAGGRLPSSRDLAGRLGLSRGLVQECFNQLQAEGYLTSRPGSATRVAPGALSPSPRAPTAAAAPPGPRYEVADFRSGVPDLGLAPREDWAWAIREVCRTAPKAAFDYGDPGGEPSARAAVAAYVRRVRASVADADGVLMCTGMAQAQALALQALARAGHAVVAYEDPGAIRATERGAALAGMSAVPVPVDDEGLDVVALERSSARAVLVTPAHQWPTGVVLTGRRRLELIDWARRCDGVVIEDDYDAEFRYDRDPVGSLQGLAPDRVVSLGTVSKSLAPALRLGWLVAPEWLRPALAELKLAADRGSPGLEQAALALLIESGRYDRHLRRMRTEYAARRAVLVEALTTHAPGIRVTGLAAGFHAVVHLADGRDEDEVVAAAARRGVGLYGMAGMCSATPATPRLVFGFGNTSKTAIAKGVQAVADLLV